MLDSRTWNRRTAAQFIEIAREESERLGGQVERWVAESVPHLGADWLLTDMRGEDLLAVLGRELEREGGVATSVDPDVRRALGPGGQPRARAGCGTPGRPPA